MFDKKEYNKRRREKNKEKVALYQRNYRLIDIEAYKEERRVYSREYRARKKVEK